MNRRPRLVPVEKYIEEMSNNKKKTYMKIS